MRRPFKISILAPLVGALIASSGAVATAAPICARASNGSQACGGFGPAISVEVSEAAGLGRIATTRDGKLGAVLQRDEGTVALLDLSAARPEVVGRYGTARQSLDGDLAFSDDGRWLFYARQTRQYDLEGIHVLDVSDPSAPLLVHHAPGGGAYRVEYFEDEGGTGWVILLDAVSGMVVYRLESTTGQLVPVHVSALPALKVGGPASAGIAIDRKDPQLKKPLAYITTGETGLEIFDFSDPASPVLLGSWSEVGLAEVEVKATGRNRTVYAASEYWFTKDLRPEVLVLDASDPSKIQLKKRIHLGGDAAALEDAERMQGMTIKGGSIFVAHSRLGLIAASLTGRYRGSLRVVGEVNAAAGVQGVPYAMDVEIHKGALLVSDAATGLLTRTTFGR